jgi:hypothetical protein
MLASASKSPNDTARLWARPTGAALQALKRHSASGSARAVSFSPDDRLVARLHRVTRRYWRYAVDSDLSVQLVLYADNVQTHVDK